MKGSIKRAIWALRNAVPSVENCRNLLLEDAAYVRFRPCLENRQHEPSELIRESKIWFSSVQEQDDRFEGRPLFEWDCTPPDPKRILELSRKKTASEAEAKRETRRILGLLADPITQEWVKYDIEQALSRLFSESSIVSFFRSPFIQNDWYRYSDQGRGYGLVFDLSIPWIFQGAEGFPSKPWVPFRVEYVPNIRRPCIQLRLGPADPRESFDDVTKALLTKSADWSAQREERFIRVGVPAGHVRFPPESLRAIVFGDRINDTNRQHILSLARTRSTPLPVFETRESRKHFSMDLVPIYNPGEEPIG